MRSRWIILICILVSLLLHGLLLLASRGVEMRIVFPDPEPPEPRPERIVKLLPPEPRPEPEDPIGERDDLGEAINAADAPAEQTTPREAPTEQAMLSTDPVGQEPDEPAQPAPQPQPEPQPEQAASESPEQAEVAQEASPEQLPDNPLSERLQGKSDEPANADTKPKQLAVASPPSPEPAQEKVVTPEAAPPASKPAGDPAPQADRESDAFGPDVSLELVAGRVEAQQGRQVKFKRPRVNLAGFVDTAVIALPARARLRIEIDDTGTPRRVTILRSTGSSSIDRAFELAAYNSWFEPIKAQTNPSGRESFELNLALR